MRSRIAALVAALTLTGVGLLGAVPAQAAPNPAPTGMATQDVAVTKPPSLAGKKAAPFKLATGSSHGLPGVPGQKAGVKPGGSVAQRCCAVGQYHYAYAQSTVPGSPEPYFQSYILISNPTLPSGSYTSHTLGQLSVQAGSNSGSYKDNIAEVGWVREPTAFGDDHVRLFGSCWRLNAWAGSYTGGCGWVDNASNPVNLGADLTSAPGGLNLIGQTKKFAIQYSATACGSAAAGQWVWFNTDWVGCWPTDSGSGHFSSYFIGGEFDQAFGEIYKDWWTCIGMGNDIYPTTSTSGAAYFNTLSWATSGAANGTFTTPAATDPAAWGVLKSSNTAFWYGGIEQPAC